MARSLFSILFVLLLLPGCDRRKAGNEALNGGGLGEKVILTALAALPDYLTLCLGNATCEVSPDERQLLNRIASRWKETPLPERTVQFSSPAQSPGLFQKDGLAHGTVRSAWGSPIWVNVDHLYRKSGGAVTEVIGIPSAVSLLLDEVAHQIEPRFNHPREHYALDLLCSKVQRFLEDFDKGLEQCGTADRKRRLIRLFLRKREDVYDRGLESIALSGCFSEKSPRIDEYPSEVEARLQWTGVKGRPKVMFMAPILSPGQRGFRGEAQADQFNRRTLTVNFGLHNDNARIAIGYNHIGYDNEPFRGPWRAERFLDEGKVRVTDERLVGELRTSLRETFEVTPDENGLLERWDILCHDDGSCKSTVAMWPGKRPDRRFVENLRRLGGVPVTHPFRKGFKLGINSILCTREACELSWFPPDPLDWDVVDPAQKR